MRATSLFFFLAGACAAPVSDSQALDAIELGCAAGADAGAVVGSSDGTTCDCDVQRHMDEILYHQGFQVEGYEEVCTKNDGDLGCVANIGPNNYGSCWAEAYIRECSKLAVQQGCAETCTPQ